MIVRLAACGWAVAFALVHVYWLAGGPLGLPPEIVASRPPALFFAAAIAVPLLVLAGSCALIAGTAKLVWLSVVGTIGVVAVTSFCLVHAVPPLLSWALHPDPAGVEIAQYGGYGLWLYEPNWLVGGLVFANVLRTLHRDRVRMEN